MKSVKRKGESFAEFLTAAAVFGVMMAGIFEFTANQTANLAKIRYFDDLMYHAQVYMNAENKPTWDDKDRIAYNSDGTILTIQKKSKETAETAISSMEFRIKP